MALLAPARQPVRPTTVRPMPPAPTQATRVLQSHRTPTQLSLFSPPAATRPGSR